MYHSSTQYNRWLFTSDELKDRRTKANNEYIERKVGHNAYRGLE